MTVNMLPKRPKPRLESLYCTNRELGSVSCTTEISVVQFRTKCVSKCTNFGNIFLTGMQFTKVHMQNAVAQFLKCVERTEIAQKTRHKKCVPYVLCVLYTVRSNKFACLTNP